MRGECCSALYSEWSIKTKLLCTAEVITQLVIGTADPDIRALGKETKAFFCLK